MIDDEDFAWHNSATAATIVVNKNTTSYREMSSLLQLFRSLLLIAHFVRPRSHPFHLSSPQLIFTRPTFLNRLKIAFLKDTHCRTQTRISPLSCPPPFWVAADLCFHTYGEFSPSPPPPPHALPPNLQAYISAWKPISQPPAPNPSLEAQIPREFHWIFFGVLVDTPVCDWHWVWRRNHLMNVMSRDIQIVLHQHA